MHAAVFGKSAVEILMPGLFGLHTHFGGTIPGLPRQRLVKGSLALKLSNNFSTKTEWPGLPRAIQTNEDTATLLIDAGE
jgi:hypothetical protein